MDAQRLRVRGGNCGRGVARGWSLALSGVVLLALLVRSLGYEWVFVGGKRFDATAPSEDKGPGRGGRGRGRRGSLESVLAKSVTKSMIPSTSAFTVIRVAVELVSPACETASSFARVSTLEI